MHMTYSLAMVPLMCNITQDSKGEAEVGDENIPVLDM